MLARARSQEKNKYIFIALLARPCYGVCAMKKKMTPAQKAAQILSKLGASKGGKERAKTLTPERRKEIARKAAETRWATTHKSGV
jgi:hypothetical protein